MDDLNKPVQAVSRVWIRKLIKKDPHDLFEYLVAHALIFLVSLIVIIALYKLGEDILVQLIGKAFDPLNHDVFQTVFGGIMTLLIAMGFKHSIAAVARGEKNVIQVRTVLMIAMMALTRKFIILDISTMDAANIGALAAAMLALGAVYWLMRDDSL